MSHLVLTSVDSGVASLILNRPEKRNALNAELIGALVSALADTAQNEAVRVVLIKGEGTDFCAGADLSELQRITSLGPEASLADAQVLGDLFITMRRHPKPIIAAVQGRALAGGAGLATACDLVVASDDAELGYPEVHLGFVPAMVMAILVRKVGESRAFELATRGDSVSAQEGQSLGLVNRVFPSEQFEDQARSYAAELAARPASAVQLSKRLLYGLDGTGFEDAIGRGAEVNALARLTDTCREGVRRFLQRHGT